MIQDNYFLLSGAMGGGKSAVLDELRRRGCLCLAEPAREILAEQRLIAGDGVPETNSALFTQLMLSRAIHDYRSNLAETTPVLFDRGIPDTIAYARLFGLDAKVMAAAASEFRYHPRVFFFPGWEEIYVNDAERKIGFEGANAFGEGLRRVFAELAYEVFEVPRVSLPERVDFILTHLSGRKKKHESL